ncbi:MAG: gamma-glutamyltransferase, partial [Planctomycetota bacterium]
MEPAAVIGPVLLLALAPAQGAVATSEAHATAAAAAVLAEGGNAVDAAVAAGFALAVTWPVAGNLGGGGFLLYRSPAGEAFFLDFREVAPAAAGRDLYLGPDGAPRGGASTRGWLAVAVPGSVPGLAEAHRRWGRLPWRRLLRPAIRLAEEGFPVTPGQAASFAASAAALRADPLAA